MRRCLSGGRAARAAFALACAAFFSSGCGPGRWSGPSGCLSGRRAPAPGLRASRLASEERADDTGVRGEFCGVRAGDFLPGYHYRRPYGSHGPPGPYRAYGLLASAQVTQPTGAALNVAGVKLGEGWGWSLTFADSFVGGEGWIGGATYDVEGSPSDATLFFIRGGLRMAFLDARPLYAFAAVGVGLDWLSSSEFPTLGTVDIGDEGDFAPVGFYFRLGAGVAFANVVAFGEFATTGAWMSDVDFTTQGWLTTWGASVGVGVMF